MKDQIRVAIVTGASGGIGREIVLKFAEKGYHVALVMRKQSDLGDAGKIIADNYGQEFITCIGDLEDDTFYNRIVSDVLAKWGRIDVLVNNAAWRSIESMRTMTLAVWEKTLSICLTGPAFLAQAVAKSMEERNMPGVIVNISSIMSDRPGGNSPAYIATKGAIESLTKELAVTYGRSGIRVVCVKPGNINTAMSNDYTNEDGDNLSAKMSNYIVGATPLARAGASSEIANTVCWLASSEASFITGTSLVVDGGFMVNINDYAIKSMQFPKEY